MLTRALVLAVAFAAGVAYGLTLCDDVVWSDWRDGPGGTGR